MITVDLVQGELSTSRSRKWFALVDGKRIAASSDPEFAACRALAKAGFHGPVQFRHQNGTIGMRFAKLEVAAEFSTDERSSGKKPMAFTRSGSRVGLWYSSPSEETG